MWMGTAEGLMERIKNGMPEEWRRLIGTEVMGNAEGDVGGGIANLKGITTRIVSQCLRAKVIRRPAGEKVWEGVMTDMDGKRYGLISERNGTALNVKTLISCYVTIGLWQLSPI